MRIKIISESTIKFPEKCVVCGEKCINEEIGITGQLIYNGWFFERLKGYLSQNPKINIPYHKACYEIIKPKETLRHIIITVIALLSAGIYYLLRKDTDYWIWSAILIPAITANFLLKKFWYEEPFRFTQDQDKYEFVFGNEQVAKEFKELNNDNLYDIGKLFDRNLNQD